MKTESTKVWANIRIGIGIIVILIAVSGLFLRTDYLHGIGLLCFGVGNLLDGIANGYTDKTEKGKTLTYLSAALLIIGSVLIIYHLIFS